MIGFRSPEDVSFDDRRVVSADHGRFVRALVAERHAWQKRGGPRFYTEQWLREQDPHSSLVVQVGANDHSKIEPAGLAIDRGWSALLVEPVPHLATRLRHRYADRHERVDIVAGAVCGSCQAVHASTATAYATMWAVDLASRHGQTIGSNTSDPRCARVKGAEYVSEIASLSREHVLNSDRNLAWGPSRCAECSAIVGRRLPSDCLRNLVRDHLVSTRVPCVCLATLLARRAATNVSLLMVDTEGHDLHVLRQYPFETLPTWRVIYETKHLSGEDILHAARLMHGHGFVSLLSPLSKGAYSVWHRNISGETLRPRRRGSRGVRRAVRPAGAVRAM